MVNVISVMYLDSKSEQYDALVLKIFVFNFSIYPILGLLVLVFTWHSGFCSWAVSVLVLRGAVVKLTEC